MATSAVFDITSSNMEIGQVTAENIQETAAEHQVYSNSNAGEIIVSIRTTTAYDENSLTEIISGQDAVYTETKAAETDFTTAFYSFGLTPGVKHYVGAVHKYTDQLTEYFSEPFYSTEFTTASYPQENVLPYQVSPYPDRLNHRDVTVYADLAYGWGGDDPKTFEVNRLPPGLSMDENGIVTGVPSAIGTLTGINVTCTNALGSREGISSFNWVIDRLNEAVGVTKGERKRSELFEATRRYAEREDIDVEDMLPTMLTRADALLTRELRARNMCDRLNISIVESQNEYALPEDYELLENLKIVYSDGSTVTPVFVTSEQANNRDHHHQGPYFTIENNQFRFVPALMGSGVIEVTYFKYIPYMAEDDSGNWLLDRWFDVYHNAMMVEVSAFVKDQAQVLVWKGLLDDSLVSAKNRTQNDMWTQPGLQIRTE